MAAKRTFRVHFIKPGVSTSGSMDVADKEVTYEGKEVTIKR
jgi:alpha-D-xyloside xylohydrolase